MTPTQFEQDDIHEMVEQGCTANQIAEMHNMTHGLVQRCAARYRAFLSGEADSPYLDGTRLTEPPDEPKAKKSKKSKTRRIEGGTGGRQVF